MYLLMYWGESLQTDLPKRWVKAHGQYSELQ